VSSPGYGEQTGHKKKELFTMKIFSANIEDLRTLYISDLKKAFDMEQKITDALPTMIDKSTDPQLATAFRDHLRQTEGHVASVEGLLRKATGDADTMTCKAISGLITEAQDSIKDASDASIRDITLIACGRQVEHHEIAVYGTLRTWANLLGLTDDARVLDSILSEEKQADVLLSSISDGVNLQAAA
jgi:ferritin-like metal-binding protein YciE